MEFKIQIPAPQRTEEKTDPRAGGGVQVLRGAQKHHFLKVQKQMLPGALSRTPQNPYQNPCGIHLIFTKIPETIQYLGTDFPGFFQGRGVSRINRARCIL